MKLRNCGSRGVMVIQVTRNAVAHRARIRVGDVVTHLNNIPVTQSSHAVSIIQRAFAHGIEVHVRIKAKTSKLDRWLGRWCW